MLIVSGTSRQKNRLNLEKQLCQPKVPVHLRIRRSQLDLEAVSWRTYWQQAFPFFNVDLCLVQRLNRLKKAWLDVLQHPADRVSKVNYCWRYFGLLHHTIRIARDEPHRPEPLLAIQKVLGFEVHQLSIFGEPGIAASAITSRNPVFLLGQLAADPTLPTPRHIPLLMPYGQNELFYNYRQLQISGVQSQRILISPAVDLTRRADSFAPIDRFTRLLSNRGDPYWKPRARLLVKRLFSPLLRARTEMPISAEGSLSILDLGAGTGQLLAKAWTYLGRAHPTPLPKASFHFVDSSPPASGRAFGLSRDRAGVTHVEWTTADYRVLVDDDEWLKHWGPFDWILACRIFDNVSNFMIEPFQANNPLTQGISCDVMPHRCLSPSRQSDGDRELMVSTVRRHTHGGTAYPQFSLRDYFAAMRIVQGQSIDAADKEAWYLPVRRFNPASLITPSGRSLLAQLMKVSRAIIIEDVDVLPEHLKQHQKQFGLVGTAAVLCADDGVRTEANHFVVTSPQWARYIRGERLW